MKKILLFASALAGLFLAGSCQRENLEPMESANTVTYTVQVPGALSTKTIGENVAAVTELVYEVYRTEATSADDHTKAETRLFHKTATITNGTATVEFELVNNQNFRVLFWAQVPENGVYTVTDLKNVTISQALNANAENYAAFAGADYIKAGESIVGRTLPLVRPIAQLNIGTDDASLDIEGQTDVEISTTAVTVNGLSTLFNVAKNQAGEISATDYVYDAKPVALSESTFAVNGINYNYVAMNYVGFAPQMGTNVEVTYTINTENVGTITNTIDNVPVKANHRTNIVGNLITSMSDYTITLDNEWEGDREDVEVITDGLVKFNDSGVYQISNAHGLAYASQNLFAQEGGSYVLTADIDMTGSTSVLTKAAAEGMTWNSAKLTHAMKARSFEFDGKGYTIKNLPGMFIAYTGSAKSVVVKNLTLETPNVAFNVEDTPETDGVGAFIGYAGTSTTITLDNCHVEGGKIEGGHWTGGLVGYAAGYSGNDGPVFETLTIKGCSVKNATVTGKGSCGGIIGHATGDAWTLVDMDNIVVTSNSIISTGDSNNKAGSVMGTLGNAGQPKTVNGVTMTGGVTIDRYEVSGNRVESNKVANAKLWGRQGNSDGVLTVDGEKVTDFGIYEEPESEFTYENGVYTLQTVTASALTDIVADASENSYGDITIELTADQALSWASGSAGNSNKLEHDGKVTIKNGTLSITGAGSFVVENDLVLENVKVVDNTAYYSENGETAWEFCYLELTAKGTYKNCIFENTIMVDGQSAIFENCKFLGKSNNAANVANEYAVWVYNGTAKFENCDFTGARGMKICDYYSGVDVTSVEVVGCKFNDLYKKPGIAIDERQGETMKVTVRNSTFTNVQPGDQGLYIYETDNVVPSIYNSKAIVDGVEVILFDENGNRVLNVSNDTELASAIATTGNRIIMLASGTYSKNINLTVAALGAIKGDITFKAAESTQPVIAGTVTLGYRNQGVGAAMWDANVTFEGIVFDHAEDAKHSLSVQDVKSLTLKNCTIIGDGEYGIDSARGNATGTSKIEGCTFSNAAMQILGGFGTGLTIDDCTFNQSRINVQAGNGVTVQNCTFNNTLKSAHVGDSFYCVRSNSTPITVKATAINIDSELTEVATSQAKWYLLANRGTTNWTVNNVAVNMTAAALKQTEIQVVACTSTGVINTQNLTLNGAEWLPAGVSQTAEGVYEVDINVPDALTWLKSNKPEVFQNGTVQYGTALYSYSNNGANVNMSAAGENAKTVRGLAGSSVVDVTVSEGIKIIGNRTFRDAPNLDSVVLPQSLTELEEGAFQGCGLTTITIPGENVTLGKQSIGYLPNLETITITAKNVTIENYVARSCPKLKSVYIYSNEVTFAANGSMFFTDCESNNTSGITFYVSSQAIADAVNAATPSGHAKGMQIKSIDGSITYYTR